MFINLKFSTSVSNNSFEWHIKIIFRKWLCLEKYLFITDLLNKLVSLIVIFALFIKIRMKEEVVETNDKVSQIISAAQIRFGLYGIEKTSMREIASDLKLSKASLYYYFPDKESLYKAVVEKELEEFIARISEIIERIDEPGRLLLEYANSRLSYFRTLLNLSRLRLEAYSDLRPVFRETLRLFKEKEKAIIIQIFNKGIDAGIFLINDKDRMASLFLDLHKGLRVTLVNDKRTLFIEQDEYDLLLEKTISFTELFIRGISIR
jgi:AcrR family transcriptional regulator